MNLNQCIVEVLRSGLDDWIQASEVASIAIWAGGAKGDQQIRQLSLDTIHHVLERGWMRIGELSENGFVQWRASLAEALERVEQAWPSQGTPDLGDVCWLANTELGNKIAKHFGFQSVSALQPPFVVEKLVSRLNRDISALEKKIARPSDHVQEFDRLSGSRKRCYLKNWEEELGRRREQLEILSRPGVQAGEELSASRHRHYLLDLGYFLWLEAYDAKSDRERRKESGEADFFAGRLFAFYEVISLMISLADAFDIPVEELSVGHVNPDRDLT